MLAEELKKLFDEDVVLEHPANPEHGDYSTNIALVLAKKQGKDPREVAESLVLKVKDKGSKILERVEIAGPGFINLFLAKTYLLSQLKEIAKQKAQYGGSTALGKKKIMVEFTDPNPFKEFHIGHLYSNIVGESLSRLFESQKANVKRANYQGDVGMHVAKAIWGMKKRMESDKLTLSSLGKKSLEERAKFLGQAYALGADAFELDENTKKEIGELNKKIFALPAGRQDSDKEVKELYEKGRKWSLDYFEKIYKRLGTKFNYYYFESNVGKVGTELVKEGLKKGVFQESQGAVIFPGEKYGLHSRVFISSQGLPTYEAKELGLAPTKYKDFKYDTSVIVTGNEIIGYFKVLLQALKLVNPEIGNKTFHVSHGMVRLPEGKMSSRTGKILAGDELIDQVQKKVLERFAEVRPTSASEAVALAAIKYSLLKVTPGRDIIFDFDKSLSLEGDSGPYLQYTYARCKSILRKSNRVNSANPSWVNQLGLAEFEKEEMDVLRYIYRFPEVVAEAAKIFSPNLVAQFAVELAQKYNTFYNVLPVLQAETKELKQFRLALTSSVAQVLQNSLHLLGIETLERM